MHVTAPAGGDVALTDVDALPAVTLQASSRGGTAAVASLHAGLLVVIGERFDDRALEVIRAVAGQASLALRNAELLEAHRREQTVV